MLAGIFLKNASKYSLLRGRCWRPGIEALVCEIFRNEHVLGLLCLLITLENDVVQPAGEYGRVPHMYVFSTK